MALDQPGRETRHEEARSGATVPIEFIGGFESTYLPGHDTDVFETTGHDRQWRQDLFLLRACGVSRLRYPIRWHRVEGVEGEFDWSSTDEVLGFLRDHGFSPIVDLVHHTSYPAWLSEGFADARFGPAYRRFAEAFAARYPWVPEYTLFNEPFSTLFLSGHEAIWPPYHRGIGSFTALLNNVLPAITDTAAMYRDLLPGARHVWVDACERHTGVGAVGLDYAEYANDRRFAVLDAVMGRLEAGGGDRPFVSELLRVGGEPLLGLQPLDVDVLGLDYYAHCQWHFGPEGGEAPTPTPPPLSSLMIEYARRYDRPVALTETNVRGLPSDRATWLKYTLEQCERAVAAGVDVDGFCWFPFVDSCDWDSLLFRCDGNVDPVGVVSIGSGGQRQATAMTAAFSAAAHGAPSSELEAYELQEPVRSWLAGYLEQMPHWSWASVPEHEALSHPPPGDQRFEPLRIRDAS